MKKVIIGIFATTLLASAAVFAYNKATKKEECKGSECCFPGSTCCDKK